MKKKSITHFFPLGRKCKKLLLIMRLSLILIFATFLSTTASVYSQSVRVNLNLKDATLEKVFHDIQSQTEFDFFYKNEYLPTNKIYNESFVNERVDKVLDKVLKGTGLIYRVLNKDIVVTRGEESDSGRDDLFLLQQKKTITGKITDNNGQTLPGVTVVVKGTTQGTVTNADGNYSLPNVPDNATLLFSFVGMKTQEVTVGNQSTINIEMQVDAIGIEEVVAIGYGTINRRDVTTAISTVKNESLQKVAVQNVGEALIGKVSGVQIEETGGEPGSVPSIKIRGIGSLRDDVGPLYVIDGYPTDDRNIFASIAPENIERIDILKDAASAAIYGSRAGNGVILITTKSGHLGKPNFSVKLNYGIEQTERRYDVLNAQEFVDMATEAYENSNKPVPEILTNKSLQRPTDWQEAIFRMGTYHNHSITATGGTDQVKYFFSGGYIDHQGVLEGSWNKRFNFNAKIDAQLNEKLRVGINFIPSIDKARRQETSGKNNSTNGGVLAEAVTMPPILPVYKDNGDYYVTFQDPNNVFNDQITNPLNKIHANKDYEDYYTHVLQTYLELDIIHGLVFKTEISNGMMNYRRDYYREAFFARAGKRTGNISTPDLSAITAERNNNTQISWYFSNTLNYNLDINEKSNITALLGYDYSNIKSFNLSVTPRTDKDNPVAFDNTAIKSVQGAILKNGDSWADEYRFDAVFGRVVYNFDNKYVVSASSRYDRSSRFGPNKKAGLFSSVALAWNLKEENFMQDIDWMSMLKLRASYGETGNDKIGGSYAWLSSLNKDEWYSFNGQSVKTVRPDGFSNYDLSWEKNKQYDIGVDLGLFSNRLNVAVDLYKRNSNIIFASAIPAINGKASSLLQNLGDVENKGFELTINSPVIDNEFKWTTNFVLSANRNKIIKLTENQKELPAQSALVWNVFRYIEGQPIGDIYMYKVIGTFNNETELAEGAKRGSQQVGDLRFEDVSGPDGVPDGVITSDDLQKVGNFQPDFVFGFSNSFKYKNFTLDITTNGQIGGELVFTFERAAGLVRTLENNLSGALGRWQSETDPGNGRYPVAGSPNVGTNVSENTRFLYSSDFLRIKNITLGYTLPNNLISNYIKSTYLYFSVKNLYTFTNYPGLNPESNHYGNSSGMRSGVDAGSYPLARNFTFGLNLTF